VRRVVGEAGHEELVRLDHPVAIAEAELPGERDRVGDLGPRHRLADGGDRVAARAERLGGDREQERRVDTARKGDDDLIVGRELRAEGGELVQPR
jgi:hypothetical protein